MTRHFALLFVLLVPLVLLPAFGAVEDFTTDKSVYNKGDRITVSGNVSYNPDNPYVSIQVLIPDGNLAHIDTFLARSDGSFTTEFVAGGPKWPSDGTYTIKVTYEGNLEKTIRYQETPPQSGSSQDPTPEPRRDPGQTPERTPEETPERTPAPGPSPGRTPEPKNAPEQTTKSPPAFATLKLIIPNFPALDKPPQHYVDRYNNEPAYKSWFDSQFPSHSIHDVVGYGETRIAGFPAPDKAPQYYINRYNNEPAYKSWFDSQFPSQSIHNVLGYEDPVPVPGWIRDNAEGWATGKISDSEFVTGIEFMLENNIIMLSSVPEPRGDSDGGIPTWVRNNAHWWSQDMISEDEFLNSLKYLIQEGIIIVR